MKWHPSGLITRSYWVMPIDYWGVPHIGCPKSVVILPWLVGDFPLFCFRLQA